MHEQMPDGLSAPSRILGSLNGQEHVTDALAHQVKSYGFFVHEGGAVITTVTLDPKFNSGDLTWLDGVTLTALTEYIIPGILSVQLASGGVSLFKTGE